MLSFSSPDPKASQAIKHINNLTGEGCTQQVRKLFLPLSTETELHPNETGDRCTSKLGKMGHPWINSIQIRPHPVLLSTCSFFKLEGVLPESTPAE